MLHTGGDDGEGGIGKSRISVPFFYEPNFDAVVAPLPQFRKVSAAGGRGGGEEGDGAGAVFEPVVYGEHLTRKVYSNFESEEVTLKDVPKNTAV